MLPVEHNDPINAKILAISEDKIEGFVREPFEEIAQPLRCAGRDGDGADRRDAARRDRPPRAANVPRHQSRRRRARRLEGGAGENRRGLRLHVAARSLFRPRRLAFDRCRHARLGLQALDDPESPARIFAPTPRRTARGKSRRGPFPAHAGERNFHSRRGSRPPENGRAREQSRDSRRRWRRCTSRRSASSSGRCWSR